MFLQTKDKQTDGRTDGRTDRRFKKILKTTIEKLNPDFMKIGNILSNVKF